MQTPSRRKDPLFGRAFSRRVRPERNLPLTLQRRQRLVSRFGLTDFRLRLAAERLRRAGVYNYGGYAPLFCVMKKALGSFRGKEILELGSQKADFAAELKRLGAKVSVLDEAGVNQNAGAEGKKGPFEMARQLFFGREFDAVVSNWSFGNFRANNLHVLYNLRHLLKPGAPLIVSTDVPSNITRQELQMHGFKVPLYATNLKSTYGLELLIDSSIFMARTPFE